MEERSWSKAHSPKNLSMSLAIEASELMEIFQWISTEDAWNIAESEEFTHLKEVFNRIKGVDLMLDLVESYSDVVRNAREFLDSVVDEGLVNKLSMFRHWYYVEEINAFAPSKSIG